MLLLKRIGRHDVIQGCVRKRRFETKALALSAYDDAQVYLCPHCDSWHVTRKPQG